MSETLEADALLDYAFQRAIQANPPQKELNWSEDEIRFLRDNHAKLLDFEIAQALGRSENAVKVYRVRSKLPAASRSKSTWVTSNEASKMLGVEVHAFTWWCDNGLIPFTMNGPNRFIRVVRLDDLKAWAINTDNWIYFDWRKICDPHLRRLCSIRAGRWGDEWWTTRQVADYHGVDVKDVTRYIGMGRIKTARQPLVSKGGRHPFNRRWTFWFVLKSEAIRLKFIHHGDVSSSITPGGDLWILIGRDQLKLSWSEIGRRMGSRRKGTRGKSLETIRKRYLYLQGLIGQAEEALFADERRLPCIE